MTPQPETNGYYADDEQVNEEYYGHLVRFDNFNVFCLCVQLYLLKHKFFGTKVVEEKSRVEEKETHEEPHNDNDELSKKTN